LWPGNLRTPSAGHLENSRERPGVRSPASDGDKRQGNAEPRRERPSRPTRGQEDRGYFGGGHGDPLVHDTGADCSLISRVERASRWRGALPLIGMRLPAFSVRKTRIDGPPGLTPCSSCGPSTTCRTRFACHSSAASEVSDCAAIPRSGMGETQVRDSKSLRRHIQHSLIRLLLLDVLLF
jgi:hypothetical protein